MLNGGDHAPARSGASLCSMHRSAPARRRLPQTRTSDERRFAESKLCIYRDRSCVAALGEFLNRVARNGGCDG
jgi:hypothetical protein